MNYLRIGRAGELKDPKERRLYRFLELVPGGLTWLTLVGALLLAWMAPFFTSYLLIVFAVFWFLRSTYLNSHLWTSFKKMKEVQSKNWLKKLKNLKNYSLDIKNWKEIYHVVLLPNYKEPYEVIKESVDSIFDSNYPKDRLIVVLSFEERAGEERKKVARKLKKEFKGKFKNLVITFHPGDLEGEIPGHGSNDAWASKEVKRKVLDPMGISYENVIISSFDTDTIVYPDYFARLAYVYLTTQNPTRASYQPVPLFNNNIWRVPFFSQTSSFSTTFWQMMCQERKSKLVSFSSHSMSFKALHEVGYKQPNIIADDSRIFYQCFFKFNGDYRVKPLYYPVSMDANEGKNFWATVKNIYKQKKRWAYGAEDVPYFLYGCLKNKKVPLRKKISRGVELIVGHWTWATTSVLIFALGWLPIFLGGKEFNRSLVSYSVPYLASRVMTIAMIGLITSIWFAAQLLPASEKEKKAKGKLRYVGFLLSWFLVPFELLIFDSLPAVHAQTKILTQDYLQFWNTPKSR